MNNSGLVKFANWFWLSGKYAPVKIKNTYSGMALTDTSLVDNPEKQWKMANFLDDEVVMRLAEAFADVVSIPVSVMKSFSAEVLRSAIVVCWTCHPAFEMNDDPETCIKSARYCHMNPYSIPEQIDLTPERVVEYQPEGETLYDLVTNTILKRTKKLKEG